MTLCRRAAAIGQVASPHSAEREYAKQSATFPVRQHPHPIVSPFQALISPFPSPQEFEFARKLHHSVPASPSTPITATASSSAYALGYSHSDSGPDSRSSSAAPPDLTNSCPTTIDASATRETSQRYRQPDTLDSPSTHLSKSSANTTRSAHRAPYCPSPRSHPLHTFTVPMLCSSCHHKRLHNLAKFEARAIKESVDREHGSSDDEADDDRDGDEATEGHGRERWSQRRSDKNSSVYCGSRKKIVKAKKGSLIPLICVEEVRLEENMECPDSKVEMEETDMVEKAANKGETEEEGTGQDMSGNSKRVLDNQVSEARTGLPGCEMAYADQSDPNDATTTSSASTGWSWWTQSKTSDPKAPLFVRSTVATSDASATPPLVVASTRRNVNHEAWWKPAPSNGGGGGRSFLAAKRSASVERDNTTGGTLKGMRRILGWEGTVKFVA